MFNKAKNASTENKAATLIAAEPRSSSSPPPSNNSARSSLSVIGSNTQVEGDINSDEDLTVEGRVSGIITCKQHTVTLGANGYIKGDVFAHTLHVSGEVNGNLVALHRATIHKGAKVSGTIIAPCLVLEDGSTFHGSIDMNPDNDVLKSAFNDGSVSTKTSSTLSSTSGSAAPKTTTDKPAANKSPAAQHDQTEA
ncbi:bactofilin family protein [Vreelandella neptunia]|uniref:Polymer-forming cytoskeletal protein n=1 Tax=Vreelandella neptunia TaxID=115551 RepID=A0ABS9S4V1_9GAMM|nr:polymer-forming cytoskeletal protein [Halomonas neptunia]MCH4811142.1 polymer-forming cytoskeletal protein [Halomonas neptunia]